MAGTGLKSDPNCIRLEGQNCLPNLPGTSYATLGSTDGDTVGRERCGEKVRGANLGSPCGNFIAGGDPKKE